MFMGGHKSGKTERLRNLRDLVLPKKDRNRFPAVRRHDDPLRYQDPLLGAVMDRFANYPVTEVAPPLPDEGVRARYMDLMDRCLPPLHESLMELAEREASPFIFLDWGTRPVATPEEVDTIYERELAESIVSNME